MIPRSEFILLSLYFLQCVDIEFSALLAQLGRLIIKQKFLKCFELISLLVFIGGVCVCWRVHLTLRQLENLFQPLLSVCVRPQGDPEKSQGPRRSFSFVCIALNISVAFQIPRNVSELLKAVYGHLVPQIFLLHFGQAFVCPNWHHSFRQLHY